MDFDSGPGDGDRGTGLGNGLGFDLGVGVITSLAGVCATGVCVDVFAGGGATGVVVVVQATSETAPSNRHAALNRVRCL